MLNNSNGKLSCLCLMFFNFNSFSTPLPKSKWKLCLLERKSKSLKNKVENAYKIQKGKTLRKILLNEKFLSVNLFLYNSRKESKQQSFIYQIAERTETKLKINI